MGFPRTKLAEDRAIRVFSEMSLELQEFVRKLYPVRNDRVKLRTVFDANCAGLKVVSGAVLADTVKDLPDNWIP